MSDANTGQTVECPICETSFDPTVAGGWCTNTDCGEWQYTGEEGEEAALVDESGEEVAADDPVDDAEEVEADDPVDDADEIAAEADDPADAPTASADDSDVEAVDGDDAPAADEPETDADEPPEGEAASDAGDDVESTDADDQPSTIDCPDCGSTLEAAVNFCPDCGTDVQDLDPEAPLTACPSCDADVDPEDNFCVECGEDLAAHRNGEGESDDGGDAEPVEDAAEAGEADDADAEDAVDALEAAEEPPVPDSLVLEVAGREIAVGDGDKVGREIRAALTDAGRPEDEAVRIHREHVRFVREDDSFYLLDLGDNPTELNGQTLQKGDREPVAPGDELELSGVATVDVRAP